jgi:hypothetical protein
MPTMGSQALVRILPRTHYDFSGLRDGVVRIPIAQHIDVLGYQRATLQVRLYSGALPAQSSLRIQLADDGFSHDDPANAFLQTMTAEGQEIGTLEIAERTVFPFYQSISTAVPGVFGRLMAVLVSFSGGTGGGPSVVMSMDLVLTGGSVGTTIHQPSTYLGYAHDHVEPIEQHEHLPFDSVDHAGAETTALSESIREALLRGNLDMDTPDGGYARFGNVNVGIGGKVFDQREIVRAGGLPSRLAVAIRDALVRGHLDVRTPDGGYARFGNVNIGIGGKVPRPELELPRALDPDRQDTGPEG